MAANNHYNLSALRLYEQISPRFSHLPPFVLGATSSAHNVFFGRENGREVAVKPFRKGNVSERAEHEERMYQIVRELGFRTLRRVMVKKHPSDEIAYLLTEYEPRLISLASLVNSDPGFAGSQIVKATVRQAAATLGTLHRHGISH